MARCERCGGSFLTRFKIKLKDAYICGKCAQELGFSKDFYQTSRFYSWDEIKDGKDAYLKRAAKDNAVKTALSSFKFAHYGEERDLDCTEEELEIYDLLNELSDGEDLKLVRKSPNYVTVMLNDWDIARVKYTDRTKWIKFPLLQTDNEKYEISAPEDVRELQKPLLRSIKMIAEINSR